MEYKYIESSILANIGYDADKRVLEVNLKRNEQKRHYLNVPHNIWLEFKKADSFGKFFLNRIKDNYDELRFASNFVANKS